MSTTCGVADDVAAGRAVPALGEAAAVGINALALIARARVKTPYLRNFCIIPTKISEQYRKNSCIVSLR